MLVNKKISDLVAGYDRIRHAYWQLCAKWRHPLLAAYTRRRDAFFVAKAKHREQVKAVNAKLLWWMIGTSLLCLVGLFLVYSANCLGLLLVSVGSLMWIILGGVWLRVVLISRPKPPHHPLRQPLKHQLLPDTYSRWRQHLVESLPRYLPDYGAQGEINFIKHLQATLRDGSFIVHRLQQQYGDDVDVTIVGPKGIWVFEVKYWSGRVIWRNGRWMREQSHYETGGVLVRKSPEVKQPPERQWQRMAQEVARTLQYRATQLTHRFPALVHVQGGVAFTCPNAKYEIASGTPFAWGTIVGWARYLTKAPGVAGMTERVGLQVLETLLSRHREVSDERNTRSMDAYARQLIHETETHVKAWIAGTD